MQSDPKSPAEDPASPSQAPPPLSGEEYEKYKETTKAADTSLEEAQPWEKETNPLAEEEPQEARGEPGSSGYGGEAEG